MEHDEYGARTPRTEVPLSARPGEFVIALSPRMWALLSAGVAVLLIALHVGAQVLHYNDANVPRLVRDLLDLDEEQAFGTWYASFLLLCAAGAALACARAPRVTPRARTYWRALAAGFVLLSIDEVAGVHEAINTVTTSSWALPAGLLAVLLGAAFVPLVRELPLHTRTLVMSAGCVYVGGGLGMELVGESYATQGLLDTLAYALLTAVEEGLEMGGIVLFVYAALDLATDHACRTERDGPGVPMDLGEIPMARDTTPEPCSPPIRRPGSSPQGANRSFHGSGR